MVFNCSALSNTPGSLDDCNEMDEDLEEIMAGVAAEEDELYWFFKDEEEFSY